MFIVSLHYLLPSFGSLLAAMDGYNAVIFAYGQTASGKTFTLTGSPSNPGIIPLAVSDLFAEIRATPDREFLLRASYLELYNEAIIDLLSPEVGKELSLSEGKKKGDIIINGLTECAVRTEDEVRRLLRVGEERRKVGGTDWNQRSSRSHCVFRIVIESRESRQGAMDGAQTPSKSASDRMTRISTLSIIGKCFSASALPIADLQTWLVQRSTPVPRSAMPRGSTSTSLFLRLSLSYPNWRIWHRSAMSPMCHIVTRSCECYMSCGSICADT